MLSGRGGHTGFLCGVVRRKCCHARLEGRCAGVVRAGPPRPVRIAYGQQVYSLRASVSPCVSRGWTSSLRQFLALMF